MEIRWSPQKRIKLGDKKASDEPKQVVSLGLVRATGLEPQRDFEESKSVKRNSSDFDEELNECLEMPENALNPTQMFLVDPDMELAMLRVDMELGSSLSTPQEVIWPSSKSSVSRSLSRWDTAPVFQEVGVISTGNLKRHLSEPGNVSNVSTQLVDDLDGIDISELGAIADGAQHAFVVTPALFAGRCVLISPIERLSNTCIHLNVSIEDVSGLGSIGNGNGEIVFKGVWRDSLIEDTWQLQVGDSFDVYMQKLDTHACELTSTVSSVCVGDSSSLFPDLVVFHPQIFISSTNLSGSANCHRRSVIQNRIVAPTIGPIATDPTVVSRNIAPIVGNCVHEAIQAGAFANRFDPDYIFSAGETALRTLMMPAVWLSGSSLSVILSHLKSRLESIQDWGTTVWPKIAKKLLGCETEIRALGVSGKLDMDIEDAFGKRTCIEIKTGKNSKIHVGQIVLYYLMQQVMGGMIGEEFFLLYVPPTGPAETVAHKISPRECQNIIRNRNLLASHNMRSSPNGPSLPPRVLSSECKFCPVQLECVVQAPLSVEGMPGLSLLPIHTKSHVRYMNKWFYWIDKYATGGLSVARRMRGNLLYMISNAAFNDESRILDPWVKNQGRMTTPRGALKLLLKGGSNCVVVPTGDSVVSDLIVPSLVRGMRIVLCAAEESDLDSVLDKIIEIRGNEGILKFASLSTDWGETAEIIETSTQLFGGTLKNINHDILSKGEYDAGIVINAHSVVDPHIWAVAIRCKTLVLVGNDITDNPTEEKPATLFQRIHKDKGTAIDLTQANT